MATKPTKPAAPKIDAKAPHTFPSLFGINEMVTFTPMARDCEKLAITPTPFAGRIVAVRFTAAKVFYDIVDDYYGFLFRDVDSIKVLPGETFNKLAEKPAKRKGARK